MTARFWFQVGSEPVSVDVIVEPFDTASGIAAWALMMLEQACPFYRRSAVTLITGRYLPEAA